MIVLIKKEPPPNYDVIRAAFDLSGYKPIFAYSPNIYDPDGVGVPPELIAHEEVHIKRQGMFPATWWKSYIADENFRLAEEILAHIAEYYVLANGRRRPQRREIFNEVAKRLRSPIYGYKPALSEDRSKKLLKMAIREGNKSTASEAQSINANN